MPPFSEHAGRAEEEGAVEAASAGREEAVEGRAEDGAADGLAGGGAADDGPGVRARQDLDEEIGGDERRL